MSIVTNRWKLDRYSILYGSLFGLAVVVGGKLKLYDDSNHGALWPKSIAGTGPAHLTPKAADVLIRRNIFLSYTLAHYADGLLGRN